MSMDFNLKFTTQEVDFIGNTLAKLPYQDVFLLIQNISTQVKQQQQQLVEGTTNDLPKTSKQSSSTSL